MKNKAYDEWEKKLFLNAIQYSVVIYEGLEQGSLLRGNGSRSNFLAFPAALEAAQSADRALLYANSEDHCSVILPPERWEMYKSLWPQARNYKKEVRERWKR